MLKNTDATYLWVAETVIRKHRRPLRARELVNYALEDALFPDEISQTPKKSMQARLSLDILDNANESRFVRTARGLFFLRELLEVDKSANSKLKDNPTEKLEEYIAERRMAPPSSESVLVVHRNEYKNLLNFQGIEAENADIFQNLISIENTKYLPRTTAETSNDYKQVITYTIIQHGTQILSFTRGRYNRAASFLRGARCIGFGGHVTNTDHSLFSMNDLGVRENAAREIQEELLLPSGRPEIDPNSLKVLGILNDDSSDVGVRHLAVILRYQIEDFEKWRNPTRGEKSINRLKWLDTSAEPVNLAEFEYWSQLCIRRFFPNYLNMAPSYKIIHKSLFQKPHVVCVVGAIGSGKSATTQALVEHAGYSQINSGSILAELLNLQPVPATSRKEFQLAAYAYISSEQGPSIFAAAMAAAVNSANSSRIVIDGIRHPKTLELFRKKCQIPVAVMYIYTPPDVAFGMYKNREDYGDAATNFNDFIGIFNAPVESEIKYILNEADVILYNWMGISQYKIVIKKMMKDIEVGHD